MYILIFIIICYVFVKLIQHSHFEVTHGTKMGSPFEIIICTRAALVVPLVESEVKYFKEGQTAWMPPVSAKAGIAKKFNWQSYQNNLS